MRLITINRLTALVIIINFSLNQFIISIYFQFIF